MNGRRKQEGVPQLIEGGGADEAPSIHLERLL